MPTSKSFATEPDSAQQYIDTLEDRYKKAKGAYETAKAKADRAEKEYQRALAWETLIKGYKDAMEKTDRLAVDLITGMNKAVEQTGKMAGLAEKSAFALRWLLDDGIKLAKCVEEYKCQVDTLRQKLLKADPKDPLIVGLDKLAQALAEAFNCILDMLASFMEVLKACEFIAEQLGEMGLKDTLFDIREDFQGKAARYNWSDGNNDCSTCIAPVKPGFPLKSYNTGYWKLTLEECTAVENCLEKLRDAKNNATAERDTAKACLDSLEAALKAAKEALACKN